MEIFAPHVNLKRMQPKTTMTMTIKIRLMSKLTTFSRHIAKLNSLLES